MQEIHPQKCQKRRIIKFKKNLTMENEYDIDSIDDDVDLENIDDIITDISTALQKTS